MPNAHSAIPARLALNGINSSTGITNAMPSVTVELLYLVDQPFEAFDLGLLGAFSLCDWIRHVVAFALHVSGIQMVEYCMLI